MGKKHIINYSIVQNLIEQTAGKDAVQLIKICKDKKKITDEEISKKMRQLKITEIRTILNRLHFRGIACYSKKRNNKTGWYSYTWNIKTGRIAELILEKQQDEVEKLERKLELEQNYTLFECKSKCEMIPFEIAAEYNFKCPKCGLSMNSVDNKKRVKNMREQLKLITAELKDIKKMA